jgi:3-hydroxyisobutyrate dehydrogenase-like beta-hydroxyacid dehydrogenase
MTKVGLLHPGAMGAQVGAQLRRAGHDVAWVRSGRSVDTARRAQEADLRPVAGLKAMARECAVVVSVCPPGNAVEVARDVSKEGFTGLYVDANATSPAAAEWMRGIVTEAGGRFVDAGIVGPPPVAPGTTRLFLAGRHADAAVKLFTGTNLMVVPVGDRIGAASAVKMAYAGWTKATGALLLALRSYAQAWDVEDALVEEWERSLPDLPERSTSTAETIHGKAWRYVDEMRFIADALAESGLPPGFHTAAADVFATLAGLRDDPTRQDPDHIYDLIRGKST